MNKFEFLTNILSGYAVENSLSIEENIINFKLIEYNSNMKVELRENGVYLKIELNEKIKEYYFAEEEENEGDFIEIDFDFYNRDEDEDYYEGKFVEGVTDEKLIFHYLTSKLEDILSA